MPTRRRRGFTPYRPPTPPAGSYDPALDAQVAAARRGLGDLQNQIGTQQARDVTDYATAQSDLETQAGYNQQDLGLARSRAMDDASRNLNLLTRRYDQMAQTQLQGANAAGVVRGGALLQAAAKRGVNYGIEREGLETNLQRFLADNATQSERARSGVQQRLGALALDYSPPDANNPLGGRRYQDRTTQLTQAQREQAFFGQDVAAQRAYQASGSGWDPPQRPANEFVSQAGVPYQVRGGIRYDQRGRRLGRATGRRF